MEAVNQSKKSWSVKLLETFGYRYVPEFTVQVVNRNGRYNRAVGDTFVRIFPLFESFGQQVEIGVQVIERDYRNLLSGDGVPHRISVNVKIKFDLRDADPEMAPIIVKNGAQSVGDRAAALVDVTLRREMANLTSAQILRPGMAETLETAIRKRLRGLERLGATLLPIEDNVVVKEIIPPERVQENRNEAANIDETIHNLTRFQSDEVKQALVAHLLRDMGQNRPQFRHLLMTEDIDEVEHKTLDSAFRVLRQPTGRVYDN